VSAGLAATDTPRTPHLIPAADHHVHLQSARVVSVLVGLKERFKEAIEPTDRALTGANEVIAAIDVAGIRRAVVLSGAYLIGTPDMPIENERNEVRRENDWTAAEARRFPDRLVPFASVNPLREYAVDEVTRCARAGLRGLKLHFTNSAVDMRNAAHIARVKAVFRAANAARLPLLVHMRTRAKDYGADDARRFIDELLPEVPDVPIVIAHMGGWGGYDRATDAVLGEFAARCGTSHPACRRLFFDCAFTVLPETASSAAPGTSLRVLADAQRGFPEANTRLVERIRALGTRRVVLGSDWPGALTPADAVRTISTRLLLTAAEMEMLFSNVAPFIGAKG
jgi:uncharacterized protein